MNSMFDSSIQIISLTVSFIVEQISTNSSFWISCTDLYDSIYQIVNIGSFQFMSLNVIDVEAFDHGFRSSFKEECIRLFYRTEKETKC